MEWIVCGISSGKRGAPEDHVLDVNYCPTQLPFVWGLTEKMIDTCFWHRILASLMVSVIFVFSWKCFKNIHFLSSTAKNTIFGWKQRLDFKFVDHGCKQIVSYGSNARRPDPLWFCSVPTAPDQMSLWFRAWACIKECIPLGLMVSYHHTTGCISVGSAISLQIMQYIVVLFGIITVNHRVMGAKQIVMNSQSCCHLAVINQENSQYTA